MGREISALDFWHGFEKAAGVAGQIAARVIGRGKAVDRLNKIRKTQANAFKPDNLLGQMLRNPSKGMANAAARHSSAYHSPKEKAMRTVGKTMAAGAGAAYLINKMDPDYDKQLRRGQR